MHLVYQIDERLSNYQAGTPHQETRGMLAQHEHAMQATATFMASVG
jgi:hypothetical protein